MHSYSVTRHMECQIRCVFMHLFEDKMQLKGNPCIQSIKLQKVLLANHLIVLQCPASLKRHHLGYWTSILSRIIHTDPCTLCQYISEEWRWKCDGVLPHLLFKKCTEYNRFLYFSLQDDSECMQYVGVIYDPCVLGGWTAIVCF